MKRRLPNPPIPFAVFQKWCRAVGLDAIDKTYLRHHWVILGGLNRVEVWPSGKRPKYSVQGIAGVRFGTTQEAIEAASRAPNGETVLPRADNYRKRKRILLRLQEMKCFWCGMRLDLSAATCDHVVPLSKGGSDGYENTVVACASCNTNRRDNVTETEVRRAREFFRLVKDELERIRAERDFKRQRRARG
jgi:5-methylcytosine-specific restriction endonuclease McrA